MARIRATAANPEGGAIPGREQATEFLIEFGELEAAVLDGRFAAADSDDEFSRAFRDASTLLAHLFRGSMGGEAGPWLPRLGAALDRLRSLDLPETLTVSVPEGYAYYGLYPETYIRAAEWFFRDARPEAAVAIGIRSIGTSLSSVVTAALEARGCRVRSFTLRPRGHPFDRRLALSPGLEAILRTSTASWFLVIDEGPGLSGSSMACVAERLSGLGVPDERIVFFPSWDPDPASLVSESARRRWPRHRKYTASFEEVCPDLVSGTTDLSAGRWRALLYPSAGESPCVQPQHERRKYLDRRDGKPTLLKFAGLGSYGRAKLERAARLHDAGFAPRPLGLSNGFLRTEFVAGKPLAASEDDPALLEAIARYLAFLRRGFPAPRKVSFSRLLEMVHVNVCEGLGEEWAGKLAALSSYEPAITDAPATAIDARMLPHEWLRTTGGFLKTDGLDHHDDHFFPGPQESAWDLAAATVEFGLGEDAAAALLHRFESLSGDQGIAARLPFYRIAYLSFRMGYATLAAAALPPSTDREGFRRHAAGYRDLLRAQLHRSTRDSALNS
jgi:hypothetical protein